MTETIAWRLHRAPPAEPTGLPEVPEGVLDLIEEHAEEAADARAARRKRKSAYLLRRLERLKAEHAEARRWYYATGKDGRAVLRQLYLAEARPARRNLCTLEGACAFVLYLGQKYALAAPLAEEPDPAPDCRLIAAEILDHAREQGDEDLWIRGRQGHVADWALWNRPGRAPRAWRLVLSGGVPDLSPDELAERLEEVARGPRQPQEVTS